MCASNMMNSDISSEEDYEKFKDSVDNEMFTVRNKKTDVKAVIKSTVKCSNGNHKANILHVTEQFKTHLAKKLFAKLESEIEYYDVDNNNIREERRKISSKPETGIRLFTNGNILDSVDNDDRHPAIACRRKISASKRANRRKLLDEEDDSCDNIRTSTKDRIRSAAVTPDWVLRREGVVCWTERKNRVTVLKPIGKNEYEIVDQI